MTTRAWSRGSEWHRWDPHIHTPATTLSNGFTGGWDAWARDVAALSPAVRVLGVTNYCSLRGYTEARRRHAAGELGAVELVFPNVEFRLTLQTESGPGVNIHLLFPPADDDQVARIEEKLRQLTFFSGETYPCDERALMRLGRTLLAPGSSDEAAYVEGVKQFKVDFDQLHAWYVKDEWLQANCIVVVALGKDGTSGLQADSQFTARRRGIERFAHAMFSGSPRDRLFWLGKSKLSPSEVVRLYGGLKACLHGSDAHFNARIGEPDHARYCWIKAQSTFDGLREALLEPEGRIWIGESPPVAGVGAERITRCKFRGAPWLSLDEVELNPGLVAVIGPRGSGKTALADMIAVAADSFDSENSASFIRKARSHLGGLELELAWADGPSSPRKVGAGGASGAARVRYLSQQFVERLCGQATLGGELVDEIERVVIDAIDTSERLGTSSFAELRALRTGPIQRRKLEHEREIGAATGDIAEAAKQKAGLQASLARQAAVSREIDAAKAELELLVVTGKDQRLAKLAEVARDLAASEEGVGILKRQQQRVAELASHVASAREKFESETVRLRQAYRELPIDDAGWAELQPRFGQDVDEVLKVASDSLAQRVRVAEVGLEGSAAGPSIAELRRERKRLEAELGVDAAREKAVAALDRRVAEKRAELRGIMSEIRDAEGSDARRQVATERRARAYLEVFRCLDEEAEVLTRLYAALSQRLMVDSATARKLELNVRRRVDVERWVARGEALIHGGRSGPFQAPGALLQAARAELVRPWETGSPQEAADAVRQFIHKHNLAEAWKYLVPSATLGDFGAWLFDTSDIHVEYGVRFDGTDIVHLSPGTRGIVLLTLYLSVDRSDTRPLVIDQPEENLDPQSVFNELVGYFREARSRRQVIVVTHNANLVVNTDADQVVVASSARVPGEPLPHISYVAGPLEDPEIRRHVCDILEGGEEAFRQRDRKYQLGRTPGAARSDASGAR